MFYFFKKQEFSVFALRILFSELKIKNHDFLNILPVEMK
jgi:hypothetical protein